MFYDKSKRDTVFANATNLSGAADKEGKPTAGIRLEIPGNWRTLSVSYPDLVPG